MGGNLVIITARARHSTGTAQGSRLADLSPPRWRKHNRPGWLGGGGGTVTCQEITPSPHTSHNTMLIPIPENTVYAIFLVSVYIMNESIRLERLLELQVGYPQVP